VYNLEEKRRQFEKKGRICMNKTKLSAFCVSFLMMAAIIWAAPVPDTGQTDCYASLSTNGNVYFHFEKEAIVVCPITAKIIRII